METTERLEELNVSGSPLVGRLEETVEPEENMLIQESAEIMEYPQKFVSECPTSARFVETVEPLDMSEFCTVGRSVETAETLEKSNVSGSPSASRFAETLERPGKLDIAESPTAGGCLEQLAIAPETPIQCTTLLRCLLRARKDLIFMMKMDRVLKLLRKKFVVTWIKNLISIC